VRLGARRSLITHVALVGEAADKAQRVGRNRFIAPSTTAGSGLSFAIAGLSCLSATTGSEWRNKAIAPYAA